MEVVLNRIWGCAKDRTYIRNQVVSLTLIFACGVLAMISTMFTALNNQVLIDIFGSNGEILGWLGHAVFKIAAILISVLALFLIYWMLPNCPVRPMRMLLPAIVVEVLLELLKYIILLTWPWLRVKLQHEYGPFQYSVATILWGFLASCGSLEEPNGPPGAMAQYPTTACRNKVPALARNGTIFPLNGCGNYFTIQFHECTPSDPRAYIAN
jgi:membrane protein